MATQPPPDRRSVYRAARAVADRPQLEVVFTHLRGKLEAAPGIVVSRVSRARAEEVAAVLRDHGVIGIEAAPHAGGSHATHGRSNGPRLGLVWTGLTVALIVVAGALLLGSQNDTDQPVPLEPRALARLAERSSAHLRCADHLGAGFFVDRDLLVTNAHVLCGRNRTIEVVLASGEVMEGRVVKTDEWLDLALVRVPGAGVTALTIGDAALLERGDVVAMMGSPAGQDFSFAEGLVSHPGRVIQGISFLQVDASIAGGNSGGPLLDRFGAVVGIVSMMSLDASAQAYVLPINYLVDGANALLPSDEGRSSERWTARLQAAEAEDRKKVDEFRAQRGRIQLAGCFLVPQGAVVAGIVQWAESRPGPASLSFSVRHGEYTVCRPHGEVTRWTVFSEDGATQMDPRFLLWMKRHDLVSNLYVGEVHLAMHGCPEPYALLGATIGLHDFSGEESTAVIEAAPGR